MEIRSIRTYRSGDDPRDILWKKWIGNVWFFVKEREISLHPNVWMISLIHDDSILDFLYEEWCTTKRQYIELLRKSLQDSAHILHFHFREENTIYAHTSKDPRIMILIGDADHWEEALVYRHTHTNDDIIFIDLSSPIERDEALYSKVFFTSRKISMDRYKEAEHETRNARIRLLFENQIAAIDCTTEEDPVLVLNHFFKYRYV
jgi:uncharacterized protein (DUF58 family)